MLDPRRWVLVEAWLALGLRVNWCPSYDTSRYAKEQWIQDEGARRDSGSLWYLYAGHEQWLVRDDSRRRPGFPNPSTPSLSDETLAHELAHYLVAGEDKRNEINFGAGSPEEEDAMRAEAVITAMLHGCVRVVDACTGGRPR